MELILEFLIGWFGNWFIENQKIKPGVKTVLAGFAVLLVTALFAHGVYLTWTIQHSIVGSVVMAVFTAAVLFIGICFVWKGHRCKWTVKDTE